ncbi:hypothetical protein CR194_01675 [Salipaludibacillus keqinensis]|jgi:hypothetical protein|uniref:DUF2624 domain-containing protein n=1 Tax=Salipaludibacillus keqinensis TaxID=2045207 RepID=A0A323TK00_9BACI|nr:DUF2624 family protein [Salipaludibacillus keqinensis]PYZ94274.1 hypothetical protein CR194_01675 [Salipaludibacillus keqinensis]
MNPVIRELINQKVRQLTLKELIKLSHKEGMSLTVKEARHILSIIQEKPFDIADKKRVTEIKKQLELEFPSHYDKAFQLLKPYESYLE